MPRPAIACATNASPRPARPHRHADGQGMPQGRDGIPAHQPSAGLPDLRSGRRMQAAGASAEYGKGYSRFIEQKNVKPKRTAARPARHARRRALHALLALHPLLKEVAQDDVLGFVDRGSHTTLACYPGRKLENNYSLNTVDICPVGALTTTDFRFKMRVWFLTTTPAMSGSISGIIAERVRCGCRRRKRCNRQWTGFARIWDWRKTRSQPPPRAASLSEPILWGRMVSCGRLSIGLPNKRAGPPLAIRTECCTSRGGFANGCLRRRRLRACPTYSFPST